MASERLKIHLLLLRIPHSVFFHRSLNKFLVYLNFCSEPKTPFWYKVPNVWAFLRQNNNSYLNKI